MDSCAFASHALLVYESLPSLIFLFVCRIFCRIFCLSFCRMQNFLSTVRICKDCTLQRIRIVLQSNVSLMCAILLRRRLAFKVTALGGNLFMGWHGRKK